MAVLFSRPIHKLEGLNDDFRLGTFLLVFVQPIIVAKSADDGHLTPTVKVLVKDFRRLTEGFYIMPFGSLYFITIAVFIGVVGGKAEFCEHLSTGHGLGHGRAAQVADQVDEVAVSQRHNIGVEREKELALGTRFRMPSKQTVLGSVKD